MNKSEDFSAQSKRLKQFYETTGLSVNGFAQECSIPSTRTMTQIFSDGRPPSRKVLDKIITRFPQLNLDWVILGYGEMIIPGMTKQPASGSSILKSKEASFQQISDKQIETSFGINELARKVEQAMALNAQTTQLLTNKVEKMSIALIEAKKEEDQRIERLDKERKKIMQEGYESLIEILKSELNYSHKKSEKMVGDFDAERKKINQKRFEQQTEEILKALANANESQDKQMNKKIDKGIIMVNDAMHKNAINQTEYAINYLTEKFSPKKLFPKLGQLTKNKKA